MKLAVLLQNFRSTLMLILGVTTLASCGSYQYVGLSEDGIYGSSPDYTYSEQSDVDSDQGNSYYKDYFKGKANEYANSDNEVFTDVDSYGGQYNSESNSDDNYGGWGQNNDSQVVINIQTRPSYFAMGWGWNDWGWNRWGWNNWRNRWGWNVGWNNWGNSWGWNVGWNWGYPDFGFWDPFYYNAWNSPYRWGGYGYYVPYPSRNIVYANSYRNTGYRNSNLSNTSALGTVARTRSNATRSSSSSNSSYNASRPTRSTTRSTTRTTTTNERSYNGNNTTRSSRSTTRPSRSTRSSSTTRSTRSTTRSGGSSYYRPSSSSSGSSTTRSGGSSTRSTRGGGTLRGN